MTEFEMAYLFNDIFVGLVAQTQFFFTMLTAFLVASYFAAHRLTRTQVAIVVGLFVYVSFGAAFNIYRTSATLGGLVEKMRASATAGKGLEWHLVSQVSESMLATQRALGWGVPAMVLLLFATLASVYFFFHCRRVNRKSEAGTWKPTRPTS